MFILYIDFLFTLFLYSILFSSLFFCSTSIVFAGIFSLN
jgi:hypothetical protein